MREETANRPGNPGPTLGTGTTVRLTLSSSVRSSITRLDILLWAVLLYPFLAAQNPGHKGEAAGQGQAFRYCLIVLVFINDVPARTCSTPSFAKAAAASWKSSSEKRSSATSAIILFGSLNSIS